MKDAAPLGDVFVTVTGCRDVITMEHMLLMKEGAILTNAGHFNVEVDYAALEAQSVSKELKRDNIVGYTLKNGRSVNLIAEGRLVNLAAGDGHPAEIMDMSFAVQALAAAYLAKHRDEKLPKINQVPAEIDEEIARRKLNYLGVSIDALTPEQDAYLHG
jgi:adenosylhomocysteinase